MKANNKIKSRIIYVTFGAIVFLSIFFIGVFEIGQLGKWMNEPITNGEGGIFILLIAYFEIRMQQQRYAIDLSIKDDKYAKNRE